VFQKLCGRVVDEDLRGPPAESGEKPLGTQAKHNLLLLKPLFLQPFTASVPGGIYKKEIRKERAQTCFKKHRPLDHNEIRLESLTAPPHFPEKQGMGKAVEAKEHWPASKNQPGKLPPFKIPLPVQKKASEGENNELPEGFPLLGKLPGKVVKENDRNSPFPKKGGNRALSRGYPAPDTENPRFLTPCRPQRTS